MKPKYVNKPFSFLPLQQRACFILYLSGFTYKEIQKLGIASPRTISRAVIRGYKGCNIKKDSLFI